jgi:DNA polymerase-3 subunit gamma/tau
MGQALYRKYRPKRLSEIVGQEHITTTLAHAIETGKISHAYLFTGPHGVGKTSIARILAHEVNGLPYDEDSNHLDIIEIDAASNRRIDEIRDLRDKVHISPTSAKYKVYIIDEVHMLTKEAFNALLKTLEEPPAHVIFILATTEAHKLPETIISRTQRYSFKPIEQMAAVAYLQTLADAEKIQAEPEALQLIAEHGAGSFRDSISLLDQASTTGTKLTLKSVQQMLGIAPSEAIAGLVTQLESGTPKSLLDKLAALKDQGYLAVSIAKQLASSLRKQLLEGQNGLAADVLVDLLARLLDVPSSTSPEHLLEIVLLGVVLQHGDTTPRRAPEPLAIPELNKVVEQTAEKTPEVKKPKSEKIDKPVKEAETRPELTPEAVQKSKRFTDDLWPVILDEVKKKHSTIYGVLRMSEPSFADDTLTLAFKFPFHQKQMKEAKNYQRLSDIIQSHLETPIRVDCVVQTDVKPPAVKEIETPPAAKAGKGVDNISNIFGNVEVLDS